MQTYKKPGHVRPYTAGSAIAVDEVVGPIGTSELFGVAVNPIANGEEGELSISGEHELAADSTDIWADGDTLYWDVADSNLTDDADGGTNKAIGEAVGAKAASATMARVLLNGRPGPAAQI